MVILRIRNSRNVNMFLKWTDLGLVTEEIVLHLFCHQSVTEQVENDLFRHRQDHFQKYEYALGFLFALCTWPPLLLCLWLREGILGD